MIREKADKALIAMADGDRSYKAWLEEVANRQAERLQEMLAERGEGQAEMMGQKEAMARERAEKQHELQRQRADKADKYWKWLADTKRDIDNRPPVNLVVKQGGEREEQRQRRKRELAKEMGERGQEYSEWLQSVSHAKFKMELANCNTAEQRQRLVEENVKKGVAKLNEENRQYQKELGEMQQKLHEKMVEKVRDKIRADEAFDREREGAAAALAEKSRQEKEHRAKLAKESRKAVKEMYNKVKAKPLLLETAYALGAEVKA